MIVNNAGYGVFASVEEATDEQIERVIDTNLLGSIDVIRAALMGPDHSAVVLRLALRQDDCAGSRPIR